MFCFCPQVIGRAIVTPLDRGTHRDRTRFRRGDCWGGKRTLASLGNLRFYAVYP